MTEARGRIGAVADWATLHRPHWPVIKTSDGHWVASAVNDCLPLLAPCVGVAALQLLDQQWAWVAFTAAYATYLAFFIALPWLVSIGRSFAAGYRGEERA